MENLIIVNKTELKEILTEMIADIIDFTKIEERKRFKNEETWLSLNEVCDMVEMSRQTILRKTRQGVLKDYCIGRNHRYKKSEVLDALECGKLSRRIHYNTK